MKKLTFSIILILVFGCGHENDGFKSGTFEILENDSIVGKIYRQGNYQIEEYQDGSELIARIEYKTDSSCLLYGIEKDQKGIDTIVWLNKFKEIEKDRFTIQATPFNANIDYTYEGVLIKTDVGIDAKYLSKLDSLNNK
ncbi:MAG: hypothetical protein VXW38_18420 [Bacteroidota bacterium]|nr:hypothetical protein [Bacteroidota bacterium]